MISLSLFHLNTWSLSKKTSDGLEPLTQSTKTDFDIRAVSESRVIKNNLLPIDISIPNYSFKFCLMELNAGGTMIYIRNQPSCETSNDLKIYKYFEQESTFTEKENKLLYVSINIKI